MAAGTGLLVISGIDVLSMSMPRPPAGGWPFPILDGVAAEVAGAQFADTLGLPIGVHAQVIDITAVPTFTLKGQWVQDP